MKNLIIIFVFLFTLNAFHAQVSFQKTIGGQKTDLGIDITSNYDGNYSICGTTYNYGLDTFDAYLIKINTLGDTLWTKTYGQNGGIWATRIYQTTDNGFIIYGDGPNLAGFYLLKTDSSGNQKWCKNYYTAWNIYGYSITQSLDKGFLVGGPMDHGNGFNTAFLMKTDSTGNVLWFDSFIQGFININIKSVEKTNDGGCIIILNYSPTSNSNNVYIVKLDQNGAEQWMTEFVSLGIGECITKTNDNGYIITGEYQPTESDPFHIFLIKTDINGNALWSKNFSGDAFDFGNSVLQTIDGGFIIEGETTSFGVGVDSIYGWGDYCLLKTNAVGNLLWSKSYGGESGESPYGFVQTSDSGYLVVGQTESYGPSGIHIYLVKTDSMGNSGCNQANAPFVEDTLLLNIDTINNIWGPPVTIYSDTLSFTESVGGGNITTLCYDGIEEVKQIKDYSLTNYPNPTNGETNVSFTIKEKENVTITIYDIYGKKISTLVNNQFYNSGTYVIPFDASELKSGIYFYSLYSNNFNSTKRMVVLEKTN